MSTKKEKDWTTTAIDRKDLAYYSGIKKRKGYASVKVVLGKVKKLLQRLKLEGEL